MPFGPCGWGCLGSWNTGVILTSQSCPGANPSGVELSDTPVFAVAGAASTSTAARAMSGSAFLMGPPWLLPLLQAPQPGGSRGSAERAGDLERTRLRHV